MKKLFFGTVLDNENQSYKAIMQKDFVERIELYRSSYCQASTHDENYIYTVNGDYTVDKIRKSNFEIVGTFYGVDRISPNQMYKRIESDDEFIYILKSFPTLSSSLKVVKIDKETMSKVAESKFYERVTGYAIDNERMYLVTAQNSTWRLSKENLTDIDRIAGAVGNNITVDSNYIYVHTAPTQIMAYDKNTLVITLINFDSIGGGAPKVVVHNNRLYYISSTRLVRFDTIPPFNKVAELAVSAALYIDNDAIYNKTSNTIRKINPITLLIEEQKRCVLDDDVDYLLKEEGEDLFYYFHASDRNTLRTLKEGYKLIGFERVE